MSYLTSYSCRPGWLYHRKSGRDVVAASLFWNLHQEILVVVQIRERVISMIRGTSTVELETGLMSAKNQRVKDSGVVSRAECMRSGGISIASALKYRGNGELHLYFAIEIWRAEHWASTASSLLPLRWSPMSPVLNLKVDLNEGGNAACQRLKDPCFEL